MATSNAATNYLERRVLDFIFKNNSLSFATPNNDIYVGLATAVSNAEAGNVTEVQVDTDDANYTRQQVTAADWKQSTTTVAVALTNSATEVILTDAEAANANGAVSSSANVAVDGNSGTITVGMVVTGTGISGTVRVATVTNQNNIVLSSAVSISDNVALSFDGTNTLTGGTRGTSSTTAAAHSVSDVVVCDTQRVINDNNVEFAAAAGTASTYTVTHAFVADKNIATATVNGAVSSSANVTVDANNGTIVVGDVVTGTGISGVVRVATVNSQTSIVLDTAVSISDNVLLTFDGSNKLFIGALDASKTIAVGDIFRINAGNLSIELK
jgi:ribosomal 30S subunit maturation factor RimM